MFETMIPFSLVIPDGWYRVQANKPSIVTGKNQKLKTTKERMTSNEKFPGSVLSSVSLRALGN
jgi:hypothetical protein